MPPALLDVVIVDDEPSARRTLREYCEREPDLRLVGEFGETNGALQAIRESPPHLLFIWAPPDVQVLFSEMTDR
jgi:DNA-binding NarL/FixJ family response regulator